MADIPNLLLTDTTRPGNAADKDYDRHLRNITDTLRRNLSIKAGSRILDVELLQVLHPAQNTIGYSFLLNHLVIDRSSDAFIIALVAYLTQFDPVQVRYVGPEFRTILDITENTTRATRNTQLLEPYRTALLRLDPSSSTFTTNHVSYVNLCLQARRSRQALPILDKDIVDFPHGDTHGIDAPLPCAQHERSSRYINKRSEISAPITVLDVQEYYLLGAYVYIGLQQYERAKLFLEIVLATPVISQAVDGYMIEAYKKLVLVGLVSKGNTVSLDSVVDSGSLRHIQLLSKPYDALAECFRNRDLARFHAEVDVAGPLWNEDGNLGLVQAVGEALRRYRVIDLQRTYASLSVAQVATTLSLSSDTTLNLLQDMIAQGYLQATITNAHDRSSANGLTNGSAAHANGPVLRFNSWHASAPTSAAVGSATTTGQVEAQIQRVQVLAEAVAEADRRLALTKEYDTWLRRHKKTLDAGAAAFEDPMEMDDGDRHMPGSFDEDIMAA